MPDQVIDDDDDTPTSSHSSSPQENSNITPLAFQIHPSALPFNLNSGSPNFYSQPFPATVLQPSTFGSSFNSMASLSQPTNQQVSPIKKNLRKSAKGQTRKAQSSSTRKATTSKIPKSPKKKKNKESTKEAGVVSTRKAPVYWEDEKNEKGESAMSVLLNWITTYGNLQRYKNGNLVKGRTVEEIIDYLAQHGFHGRNARNVHGKISELEKKFNSAVEWLDGTGKGVMNGINAEKEKNGWSNDNPEYLKRKKSLIEDYVINHRCKYYYQIEHILGTRDKATRLNSATSAAPNPASASLDCLRMSSNRSSQVAESLEPNTRNDDDHSQASNEEYHRQQEYSNHFEDEFNDEVRRALEDELKDDEKQSQHSEEPTPPIQTQVQHDSGSVPASQSQKTNKRGAESQVTELLSQPDTKTNSSITRLEDVFIKSELESTAMKDVMQEIASALQPNNGSKSLLTKDEQVQQAQVDAQLKNCKLEAAQLDVKKTKRAMELELAIAKGQFINQFMKDNKVNYQEAKVIADDLYKSVEKMSENDSRSENNTISRT